MIIFALPTACKIGSQQEQMNLFCRILRGWAPEGSGTQEGRGGYWKRRDYLKQTEQFRPRASLQPSVVKHLTLQMRASSPEKISQEDSLDSKASDSGPAGWSVGLNADRVTIICSLNCWFPEQQHPATEPHNFLHTCPSPPSGRLDSPPEKISAPEKWPYSLIIHRLQKSSTCSHWTHSWAQPRIRLPHRSMAPNHTDESKKTQRLRS